jgi:hypothetical protein
MAPVSPSVTAVTAAAAMAAVAAVTGMGAPQGRLSSRRHHALRVTMLPHAARPARLARP